MSKNGELCRATFSIEKGKYGNLFLNHTLKTVHNVTHGGTIMKIYVEKVRLEKKMTLAELSRRSGVAVSHLHNIESGSKTPTITVLCKIAKALEVSCEDLYSCEEE